VANGDISTLSSRGGPVNDHFGCSAWGLVLGRLLGSDGVEHGPTLFYVIAAAMRTEDFAFLVLVRVSTFENVFMQA